MQKQVTAAAKTKLAAVQFYIQNALQNLVQMTVQSSVQMSLQKNGTDAEQFAEAMQKEEQKLYAFSARVDTGIHGFSGIARIFPVPPLPQGQSVSILPIRGLFSVCRKMAEMQKSVQISLQRFVQRAEHRAVVRAEVVQKLAISDNAKNGN